MGQEQMQSWSKPMRHLGRHAQGEWEWEREEEEKMTHSTVGKIDYIYDFIEVVCNIKPLLLNLSHLGLC